MALNPAIKGLAVLFWLAGGAQASPTLVAKQGPGSGAGPPPIGGLSVRDFVTTIRMRPRESFRAALVRGGVAGDEADLAVNALADDFDTVNPHPGLELRLMTTRGPATGTRLAALGITPRDGDQLDLLRGPDGVLRLRRTESPVFIAPTLTRGVIHGSLYLSIVEAGVDTSMAARVVSLFGRRLDLTRDIESGDRFRLVFDQHRRGDGRALDSGDLLYADVTAHSGNARLYRFQPEGSRDEQWVDGADGAAAPALLRTPVDGARLTSAFGPRLHPLLGFTRMHEGVDFGASLGAPVLAAGDGVIEEARWSGGYGRWLKIRHSAALETGYGHLSAWGPGMVPGARVRQGQIVAFVGASGLATGPHLHYEVFEGGRRVDPRSASPRAASTIAQDPNFRARKAEIDAAVSILAAACAAPDLIASSLIGRCVG